MVPQLQQLRLPGLGIILEATSLGKTFDFSSPAIVSRLDLRDGLVDGQYLDILKLLKKTKDFPIL